MCFNTNKTHILERKGHITNMIHIALHRKLNIGQHQPYKKQAYNDM